LVACSIANFTYLFIVNRPIVNREISLLEA
jgi:hypothetical protein